METVATPEGGEDASAVYICKKSKVDIKKNVLRIFCDLFQDIDIATFINIFAYCMFS